MINFYKSIIIKYHQKEETMTSFIENIRKLKPDDQLQLWTIQTKQAWDILQKTGILKATGCRVLRDFLDAYRWMKRQMYKRIQGYSGKFPIWAWYDPKPDLRSIGHLERGIQGIRIEFHAPVSDILISDFDAWHYVLNGWYLALTQTENEQWSKSLPDNKFLFEDLPFDFQTKIIKSWDRIFDLEAMENSFIGPVKKVQAVLESIKLDQVIKVDEFIAR